MAACRIPVVPAAIRAARYSSTADSPLFLRPLSHYASSADLREFHSWASSLALSSSSSNPLHPSDPPHLLRELRWLLQDASPSLDLSSPPSSSTPLRVELEELYRLWKERVEDRRPLQYVVGCEHWRDLVLVVREGVLIPRPETEKVVDMVADVMAAGMGEGLWADIGTGSGALAIGIAALMGTDKKGKVFATDISSDAVEVARINVARYNLQNKVEIRQGSWFEPLEDVVGRLAGVVSNPPYIPSGELGGLQPEVAEHEPWLALDGGEDGLECLRRICHGCASALRPGGFFIFETNGDEQSKFLGDYVASELPGCFCEINIVKDFAGIGRFISGFRK